MFPQPTDKRVQRPGLAAWGATAKASESMLSQAPGPAEAGHLGFVSQSQPAAQWSPWTGDHHHPPHRPAGAADPRSDPSLTQASAPSASDSAAADSAAENSRVLPQSALLDAVPSPPVAAPYHGPTASAAVSQAERGDAGQRIPATTTAHDQEDSSDTFASCASAASPDEPAPATGSEDATHAAAPTENAATDADASGPDPAGTSSRHVIVTLPPHINPPQAPGDVPILYALSGSASSPSLVRVDGAKARVLLSMMSGDAKQPPAHQAYQAYQAQQQAQQQQQQQQRQQQQQQQQQQSSLPPQYGPPPGADKDSSAYMHHYMAHMQHAAAMQQGYPSMPPQHHMAAMAGMMPHPMQMHAQQAGQGMYPWSMMRDRVPYGYPSHPSAVHAAVMPPAGHTGKLPSSMHLGAADGSDVPLHRPRAAPAQPGGGQGAMGHGDMMHPHHHLDPAFAQHEGARSAKQRAVPSNKRRRGGRQSAHNRQCALCATRVTPKWRRGPDGSILCNACGLHKNKIRERKQFLYMKELAARATSAAGAPGGTTPADIVRDSATHNRRIAVRRAANGGYTTVAPAVGAVGQQQAPVSAADGTHSLPATLQESLAAAATALANAGSSVADAEGEEEGVQLEDDGPAAESDATVPRRKRSRRGRMPRLRVENDYEYDVDGAAAGEAPAGAVEPEPVPTTTTTAAAAAAASTEDQKAAKGRTLSILADAAAAAAADKKETVAT